MDRLKLIDILNNSKTKTEVKRKLGWDTHGRTTINLYKLCDTLNVDFTVEFKLNHKSVKLCLNCGEPIKNRNTFCGSSCSATFNNAKRTLTKETKNKISNSLLTNYENGYVNPSKGTERNKRANNYDSINGNYVYYCSYCGGEYRTKHYPSITRKTCSRACQTRATFENRSYQNGSRRVIYYFNKNTNETVVLESSWELKVAEKLDELNIIWVRPNSLNWIDSAGSIRQYYPDFYLTDFDVYLDPKNPYCLVIDKVKLEYIEKHYNIIYGDINKILKFIENHNIVK